MPSMAQADPADLDEAVLAYLVTEGSPGPPRRLRRKQKLRLDPKASSFSFGPPTLRQYSARC